MNILLNNFINVIEKTLQIKIASYTSQIIEAILHYKIKQKEFLHQSFQNM